MTPEDRFTRIESRLDATAGALHSLVESQIVLQAAVRALTENQAALQAAVATVVTHINQYIDTASAHAQETEARMRRIEENLDGLIRAITAEHSNGKQGR